METIFPSLDLFGFRLDANGLPWMHYTLFKLTSSIKIIPILFPLNNLEFWCNHLCIQPQKNADLRRFFIVNIYPSPISSGMFILYLMLWPTLMCQKMPVTGWNFLFVIFLRTMACLKDTKRQSQDVWIRVALEIKKQARRVG